MNTINAVPDACLSEEFVGRETTSSIGMVQPGVQEGDVISKVSQ